MTKDHRLMIRFEQETLTRVQARNDNISQGTREALARYYRLLETELPRLQEIFTGNEISLLASFPFSTWGNIAKDHYEKWGCTKVELLKTTLEAKLLSLNHGQNLALIDAIERYWKAKSHSAAVNPADALKL